MVLGVLLASLVTIRASMGEVADNVPPGWKRYEHNGRIVYSTQPPFPKIIRSHAMLTEYHKRGEFLEIKPDQLVFSRKRKKREIKFEVHKKVTEAVEDSFEIIDGPVEESTHDENTVEVVEEFQHTNIAENSAETAANISDKEKTKLDREKLKLTEAVSRLTIDPAKKVDHKQVLEAAAKRLTEARLTYAATEETNDDSIVQLKKLIEDSETVDEVTRILWSNTYFQSRFSQIFSSKLLEQLITLGSASENPLRSFPIDINSNAYADILHFALDNAKDVILLLTGLTKKREAPITTKDVINLAYSFSTLAESAACQNNSLKKMKTLSLKNSGLTNTGLDSLASVGVTETSRSCRNDRDLVASIAEEVLKKYAKNHVPQMTFDNLDIAINGIAHHLTLNYHEFEQVDTDNLETKSKSIEEMLEFFKLETILLKSDENKELFAHFQDVTAVTIGRLVGKEVVGMEWLLSVLSNHYKHPNSDTSSLKALIYVDKPMYLQETKNSDMFKIMEKLQLQYLNLVGEQAENKEEYFQDLKLCLSVECSTPHREEAEKRIKESVLKAGELICHGDQLTHERFENCKRLRQGSASAIERFEFMPIFRSALSLISSSEVYLYICLSVAHLLRGGSYLMI